MTTIGNESRPAYVYDAETDTWVPIGVGPHTHDEYIDKTIISAKGDIIVGTATDAVAKLGVGTTGQVLVVDPTTATGLSWTNKQDPITGAATTIASDNLTASRALLSDASGKVAVSAVTDTELGYLDNVSSNIQDQLNGKQATITGAATTIAATNLTVSRALLSDASGKVAVSAVTNTELGYLDNVSSNIQDQLNGKSPTAGSTSITTVGTVTTATSPTAAGSTGLRKITISTSAPSGGADGDVWLRYV
jgi:hypothetical protein